MTLFPKYAVPTLLAVMLSMAICGNLSLAESEDSLTPCVDSRQAGAADAEIICQEAYKSAKLDGRSDDARRALFQLAIIERNLGRYSDAEKIHIKISRQPNFNDNWMAQYHLERERGIVAYLKNDSTNALNNFRTALALASEHGDRIRVARSYNDLGNAYRHIGARQKALDAFVNSLNIKREQESEELGTTLNNIADLMTDLGDYQQAEDYYNQALGYHRSNNDAHHIADTQEARAHLASLRKQFDLATELYEKAFDLFSQLQATPDQVRVATLRAALAYQTTQIDLAEHWLHIAESLSQPIEGSLPARWYNTKADILQYQGLTESALTLLESNMEASYDWPPEQRIGILLRMAKFNELLGHFEKALDLYRDYHAETMRFTRHNHDEELNKSRILFEVSEKKRAIDQLQAENNIQKLSIKAQRSRTALVALLSLLTIGVVVLAAFALQRRRNRIENARRRELEATLEGYRRSAAALRTSQSQLRKLLDFSGDALLTLDATNRIVFINSAACQLLDTDNITAGKSIDDFFETGTQERLNETPHGIKAKTRQGQDIALNIETLSLEEELQVLTLRRPDQDTHAADELMPLINRHFSRIQSFSSILQASLDKGNLPKDLKKRWQAIDKELQSLVDHLQPVHDDVRLDFRHHLVTLMSESLESWHRNTGKSRVDLAEHSGIWRITIDEGRLRTRAMDRYLTINKLPKNPRWREVVRTAYFVLGECPQEEHAKLQAHIDTVLDHARKLGLA